MKVAAHDAGAHGRSRRRHNVKYDTRPLRGQLCGYAPALGTLVSRGVLASGFAGLPMLYALEFANAEWRL